MECSAAPRFAGWLDETQRGGLEAETLWRATWAYGIAIQFAALLGKVIRLDAVVLSLI